jgi:hypothetical protein
MVGAAQARTPVTSMVAVPWPLIRAPILMRQSARSTISGSRAALSMTVVPLARVAAISDHVGAADGDLAEVDLGAPQAPVGGATA